MAPRTNGASAGSRPQGGAESILPLFPLLSSHDPPTRLDASLSLLTALPALSSTSASPASAEDADTPYAIKRLVTGLGSSNEASRQGFAVALTELLARLPADKAATVLPLILSTSTPTAGSESREERDLLFARLLGLHAVVRSGVLFRAEQQDGESFKEVILALLALSGKKSWIREPAYWTLIESVRTLLELSQPVEWRDEIATWVIQRLLLDSREKARGWNPEKIALVLVLQTYGVEADYVSVLSPSFPSGNPLARSSLSALAQAIKGSVGEAEAGPANGPKMGSNAVKTSKAGAPLPGAAPHFVWSEIFDLYFPAEDAKARSGKLAGKEPRAKWLDVWRILVDQSLFAPPSLPLKATGFALLSLAIQRLPPTDVPALFGEGVVRTFGNHLRKTGDGEKTLSRVAEKLATSLPPFLAANPSVSLPLLKALVAPPFGSHLFDHKTIEKIVAKLDLKGTRGWVAYLKEFVIGAEQESEDGVVPQPEEEKIATARRTWAFDQLLHVVKSGSVPKDDELIAGLLEFFAVLGWFEVRKSGKGARSYVPVPAFTESLQIAARSRFFSVLTALPGQPWLSRALALMENLEADTKHFNSINETEEEVAASRKTVKKMYGKLAGEEERNKIARSLVEGVVLLSYEEGEESLEALEQITDLLPLLFPKAIKAAPKAAEEDEEMDSEEGEEPEPTTVLVDLLLELLHRPSAFVKGISQAAFTGFADELGEQGMELLLEQIRPDVADAAEDEDTEMADDDEEAPKASTSAAPAKASTKGKKAAAPVEEDSDEDDFDSDDEDVDVDEDFKNELLAALQASGVADDFDAAEEGEGDESEEEILDDDQMLALDDKLADIFRMNGGGRNTKKLDRTDDMHYRLRVVDLIDALAKQRSTNPLLILTLLPLFGIVRSTAVLEEELQTKATKILRSVVQAKKDAVVPASPDSALEALAELHTVAQTVEAAELGALCSQTAIYLVKAALASPAADAETSKAIAELYGDSFEIYLSTKNSKTKVQPLLTVDFAKRSPACAWELFDRIVKSASGETSSVNAYRRMQAFEVAQALLTSYAALKTPASKSAILASMPSYRSALLSTLTASASSTPTTSGTFDASRLKDLLKFALAAIRLTLTSASNDSTPVRKIWVADDWVQVGEELRKSDRFAKAQGIQNSLKQVVGMIGGASASAAAPAPKEGKKKRKQEEVDAVEVESTPKSKKGKKAVVGGAGAETKEKSTPVQASAPEVEVEIEVEEEPEPETPAKGGNGAKSKKEKKKGKKPKEKVA